jgi:hypothetical protein
MYERMGMQVVSHQVGEPMQIKSYSPSRASGGMLISPVGGVGARLSQRDPGTYGEAESA